MSQAHLSAFLDEVRCANPQFRKKASSLRGLIDHLEATQNNPATMNLDQALGHCARRDDKRLNRYMPAIRSLIGVWGRLKPYPLASLTLDEQSWGTPGKCNCYAYAVGCLDPPYGDRGGAWPGRHGGQPLVHCVNTPALIAAIRADDARIQLVAGDPYRPPGYAPSRHVMAALCSNAGFHFLRRQADGYWSWKDGNMGTVKKNIKDLDRGYYVRITDTNFTELVATRKARFFGWASYAQMAFKAYFTVPTVNDIVVEGLPPAPA